MDPTDSSSRHGLGWEQQTQNQPCATTAPATAPSGSIHACTSLPFNPRRFMITGEQLIPQNLPPPPPPSRPPARVAETRVTRSLSRLHEHKQHQNQALLDDYDQYYNALGENSDFSRHQPAVHHPGWVRIVPLRYLHKFLNATTLQLIALEEYLSQAKYHQPHPAFDTRARAGLFFLNLYCTPHTPYANIVNDKPALEHLCNLIIHFPFCLPCDIDEWSHDCTRMRRLVPAFSEPAFIARNLHQWHQQLAETADPAEKARFALGLDRLLRTILYMNRYNQGFPDRLSRICLHLFSWCPAGKEPLFQSLMNSSCRIQSFSFTDRLMYRYPWRHLPQLEPSTLHYLSTLAEQWPEQVRKHTAGMISRCADGKMLPMEQLCLADLSICPELQNRQNTQSQMHVINTWQAPKDGFCALCQQDNMVLPDTALNMLWPCQHTFCDNCGPFLEQLKNTEQPACPTCRSPFSEVLSFSSPSAEEATENARGNGGAKNLPGHCQPIAQGQLYRARTFWKELSYWLHHRQHASSFVNPQVFGLPEELKAFFGSQEELEETMALQRSFEQGLEWQKARDAIIQASQRQD